WSSDVCSSDLPQSFQLAVDLGQQRRIQARGHQTMAKAADRCRIRQRSSQIEATEHQEVQTYLQGLFQLDVREPMPLAQQHQLEHAQRRIRLRAAGPTLFPLVQPHQLLLDRLPVDQRMQTHRRRTLDLGLGPREKEAAHHDVPCKIGSVDIFSLRRGSYAAVSYRPPLGWTVEAEWTDVHPITGKRLRSSQ